jgi:hypothetical protein
MATLAKTASVLTVISKGEKSVSFGRTMEEINDGVSGRMVWLSAEDWKELGEPEEVTVTIQPGNTLDG